MPQLEERKTRKQHSKVQSSDKCEICGKQVQEKFNSEHVLCREHALSRGDVWVLNMKSWQWQLEKR